MQKAFSIKEKILDIFLPSLAPKYRETIKSEIGSQLTFNKGDDYAIFLNELDDNNLDNITLEELVCNPEEISLYIGYQFGQGHTKQKKGKPKLVKSWWLPITGNEEHSEKEVKLWEEKVLELLRISFPEFKYFFIDYDSDFGFQGIILELRTNERIPYELESESVD